MVNNNAAAVLLALETLAHGRGGHRLARRADRDRRRVPHPRHHAAQRRRVLREVGATNRTHLRDYAEAITPGHGAAPEGPHLELPRRRLHRRRVARASSSSSGASAAIPVMEDLGSGSLVDLRPWGFRYEPTVPEVVASAVDLVTVLRRQAARRSAGRHRRRPARRSSRGSRRIPWNRALRIDKFTIAALEATLARLRGGNGARDGADARDA